MAFNKITQNNIINFDPLLNNWGCFFNLLINNPNLIKLFTELDCLYRSDLTIYPASDLVFNAFNLRPQDIKVVVLGQDPYHNGLADGLSFSSSGSKIPSSLKNIFKSIANEYQEPIATNPNLQRWADQGVFLINTTLTVEKGKAFSHKDLGWKDFTIELFNYLNSLQPIVFLLMGKPAQKFKDLLDLDKHLIVTSNHPSPLSAYQIDKSTNLNFFETRVFSAVNQALLQLNQAPIKW